MRADRSGAMLILGSATPSIESYYLAKKGRYQLLEMERRVQDRTMPNVHIVDLREEMKAGNRTVFSRKLYTLIQEKLQKKEQIMLFINRRGMAGFVSCRSCGYVGKCPHCDVSLTLHGKDKLLCHYCGYEAELPKQCPECGSPYLLPFKAGTQKIEQLLRKEFPTAEILRMDSDTMTKKNSYHQAVTSFARGEADILLGTQMIVKGHDFPNVTLVGILAADASLHISDYRAAERTFQLLTQAAGRAGRGNKPGEVVIQTYQPDHYSIRLAAEQNYKEFYQQELLYRNLMNYPPMWNLLVIHIMAKEESFADKVAYYLIKAAKRFLREKGQIIGPADAPIAKISEVYRKRFYIKQKEYDSLIAVKDYIERIIVKTDALKDASIQFDFNPISGF